MAQESRVGRSIGVMGSQGESERAEVTSNAAQFQETAQMGLPHPWDEGGFEGRPVHARAWENIQFSLGEGLPRAWGYGEPLRRLRGLPMFFAKRGLTEQFIVCNDVIC